MRPVTAATASLVMLLGLPCSVRAQASVGGPPDLPAVERYRIEAMAAIWAPGADIIVSSDAAGIPGTRIDLKRDVGMSDQRFPELQLTWRPKLRHRFRLQYIPVRFDSTATLSRDLVFNGATYLSGQPVTARLDWTTYRFGYEYDFVVRRRVTAGFIAEVKHTVVRAAFRAAPLDEVSRQAMPVPAVGGVLRLYPAPRLTLTGEATFFGVPDRADGHYGGRVADIDASAVWSIGRHLGAQLGYRAIDIHHLGEWNTADFKLKGVYAGAVVRY